PPMKMPFGLSRKTRPFESSCPRMLDTSPPVTRLRTDDAAFCWMKRVSSSGRIENACQLMIAPGVLVIASVLPAVLKLALPEMTVGAVGFACEPPAKQEATAM